MFAPCIWWPKCETTCYVRYHTDFCKNKILIWDKKRKLLPHLNIEKLYMTYKFFE